MDVSSQLVIGFVTMVVLSFLIGTFARRKGDTIRNFFYGDNTLSVNHVVNLILSTSFSMNGMVYQTWLGYSIGWAAVLMQVIWCLSFILLSKKAIKVQNLINKYGTLHGSIASQFGAKTGKVAAVATVIGFTMLVGWELIVGTSLFSAVAPNSVELKYILIFVLAGIGGIYTISGGLKGNLYANIFQNWFGVLSMVFICFFFYFTNKSNSSISLGSLKDLFVNIGVVGFITNAVFSLSWQFVDMTNWQALGSESKTESPHKALWYSAIWVLFVPGVVGTVLGLLLRNFDNLNPDSIFLVIIQNLSAYPSLLIFVSAGFVATMLSTIDGLMLASGQVVTWDLTHHDKIFKLFSMKKEDITNESRQEEKNIINLTRYWIFGLGIIGSMAFCFITISGNGLTEFTVKEKLVDE